MQQQIIGPAGDAQLMITTGDAWLSGDDIVVVSDTWVDLDDRV